MIQMKFMRKMVFQTFTQQSETSEKEDIDFVKEAKKMIILHANLLEQLKNTPIDHSKDKNALQAR